MAKFLKVHHENADDEIEEYIANLEMIVDVDEENHTIDMADGESICVVDDNEWDKIMSFVKENQVQVVKSYTSNYYKHLSKMKVKLEYATNPTAFSKLQVVKAVLDGTSYNLRGSEEYVDENLQIIKDLTNGATLGGILDLKFEDVENNKIIELLKETYSVTPLSDKDFTQEEDSTAAKKLRKMLKWQSNVAPTKPYEVTERELGVTIHSFDETTITWQNKSLLNKKQAERVISGLRDAHLDVTETPAIYKGDEDSVLLTIKKHFPSGTDIRKLKDLSLCVHKFILGVCRMIVLEEELEDAKENSIDAFNTLRDYE